MHFIYANRTNVLKLYQSLCTVCWMSGNKASMCLIQTSSGKGAPCTCRTVSLSFWIIEHVTSLILELSESLETCRTFQMGMWDSATRSMSHGIISCLACCWHISRISYSPTWVVEAESSTKPFTLSLLFNNLLQFLEKGNISYHLWSSNVLFSNLLVPGIILLHEICYSMNMSI